MEPVYGGNAAVCGGMHGGSALSGTEAALTCVWGRADELVEDGVPMGGVTATSEDVMQLDGNDVLIQCNVGLSVDDPNARAYSGPPPAHNLNLNVDKVGTALGLVGCAGHVPPCCPAWF